MERNRISINTGKGGVGMEENERRIIGKGVFDSCGDDHGQCVSIGVLSKMKADVLF